MLCNQVYFTLRLADFLKENVKYLACDCNKKTVMYVLSDDCRPPTASEPDSFLDYSPAQYRNEYLARKHLVLIYQESAIVLGMSTFEYAFLPIAGAEHLKRWSRAYVQYVDSTGLFAPRQDQSHLTKSLVKAYFKYCHQIMNVSQIHFLATAKPSFLFAGSDLIDGKRPLPGAKLVNWWLSVVDDFGKSLQDKENQSQASDNEQLQVFVYSPTEEVHGSKRLGKLVEKLKGCRWVYGWPYESKALCTDQIPMFEDDPKWKHFEATVLDDDEILEQIERSEKKRPRIIIDDEEEESVPAKPVKLGKPRGIMSVRQFFEGLQIRPEFHGETSAFFVLKFQQRLRDAVADAPGATRKADLASFGIKMLGGLTFESEAAVRRSSQQIMGWMKLMGVEGVELQAIATDLRDGQAQALDAATSEPVHSVQGLIKRKVLAK